ncbi:hypothetical protein RHMOL_Rhmol12G0012500 [Rhododendron molle]|uniref:Uncharacterized protein n=1 Tax=Rhododendron molle TaxID=49168 RepID=A0ACC0LD27_RHOML|nr:hypothetical protein RHMOL_Rhmol12G0012500 [Rhododendron molle]
MSFCVGGSPINSNRWKKGVGKSVSMLSSGPYGLKEIIFCSETKLLMKGYWWKLLRQR